MGYPRGMRHSPVGLDSIAFAVPEHYVDLVDLARARGVDPAKYVDGLGVRRMGIALGHEDPVALAANACRRLFDKGEVDPGRVGLVIVGTETAVDHSKPVAAYLHGLLGLPTACRSYETKHACFGGTAGLVTALDWIASGSARGRTALVVCTDIARYALASPGEPTQGAGAVAMLVSESPRLVALEPGLGGSYSRDVSDFWRPLYSKDAVVDGKLSVQCYLDALAGAYGDWERCAREAGRDPGDLVRRCYHVPYGKMAKKAHRHLSTIRGLSEAEADASFEREVGASLRFSAEVGNVYTGSLYLALASLLDAEAAELEGRRVGLFSYGSGSCAEYFAGTVLPGAAGHVARLSLAEPLTSRRRLEIAAYEAVRRADAEVDRRPLSAADTFTDIAFAGVSGERRVYVGGQMPPSTST